MIKLKPGIYEQLISKFLADKLEECGDNYYLSKVSIPKNQAIDLLTQYASKVIHYCLGQIKGDKAVAGQLKLVNSIIQHLDNTFEKEDLSNDLLDQEALLLKAILSKVGHSDDQLKNHINQNYSLTGYSFSTLFT